MTERKRATGFALMDAAFAADPKFLRLRGRAPDPAAFAAAVGVFWLLLADARRAKDRVLAWEDYEEWGEQIAALKNVRLLVEDGFSHRAFEKYAPAYRSVPERNQGTNGYGNATNVPKGNSGTVTSVQLDSSQFGSVPETSRTEPARVEGLWHHGQHPNCSTCEQFKAAR